MTEKRKRRAATSGRRGDNDSVVNEMRKIRDQWRLAEDVRSAEEMLREYVVPPINRR